MNKPPELFVSERSMPSDFARRKGVPYAVRRLITVVVLAGLVSGGAYLVWHHAGSTPDEIPTVKADGAYKQRPEQPGGIDIPHQDVQVYHEIDGSVGAMNDKPAVEHMLPPPEQPNPASISAPARAASVTMSAAPTIEDLTPVVAANSTPQPAVIATTVDNSVATVQPSQPASLPISQPPVAATIVPPENPAPIAVPAPVVAPPVPVQPPVVAATKPAPTVKGGVVVQLSSMPDEAAAQATARKLQVKYSADLGTAMLHTVRANLGARGIFYRVQTQPLAEKQARAICDALKNQNAGCLLVR